MKKGESSKLSKECFKLLLSTLQWQTYGKDCSSSVTNLSGSGISSRSPETEK